MTRAVVGSPDPEKDRIAPAGPANSRREIRATRRTSGFLAHRLRNDGRRRRRTVTLAEQRRTKVTRSAPGLAQKSGAAPD
jgi:hypothetical protein